MLQAFVYGNSLCSQLVAVVVPDPEALLPWARERNIPGGMPELCASPAVRDAVFKSMQEQAREAQLRGFEQVGCAHRARARVHARDCGRVLGEAAHVGACMHACARVHAWAGQGMPACCMYGVYTHGLRTTTTTRAPLRRAALHCRWPPSRSRRSRLPSRTTCSRPPSSSRGRRSGRRMEWKGMECNGPLCSCARARACASMRVRVCASMQGPAAAAAVADVCVCAGGGCCGTAGMWGQGGGGGKAAACTALVVLMRRAGSGRPCLLWPYGRTSMLAYVHLPPCPRHIRPCTCPDAQAKARYQTEIDAMYASLPPSA